MSEITPCPECKEENTYFDGVANNCPDCGHFWSPHVEAEAEDEDNAPVVRDCDGKELQDGDDVTVIKDLPVKGSSMVVKRGTRVRGIRLTENDPTHVDCKVDGTGIYLKTEFLRKA